MLIAAFVIALLALVMATAALAVTITLYLTKEPKPSAPVLNELDVVAERELMERHFNGGAVPKDPNQIIPSTLTEKEEHDLEEMFINPDAKFTGIDEEFNV